MQDAQETHAIDPSHSSQPRSSALSPCKDAPESAGLVATRCRNESGTRAEADGLTDVKCRCGLLLPMTDKRNGTDLVPSKGLEPPHRCRYMDLNHARLPIPPRWQVDFIRRGSPQAADQKDLPSHFTDT